MATQIERISEFLETLENEMMTEDQSAFLLVGASGGSGTAINNCNCLGGGGNAINNCNC